MYNKQNLMVSRVCSRGRYNTHNSKILCHPNFTAGTDGTQFLLVTKSKDEEKDFPNPKTGNIAKKFKEFTISVEDAIRIEKTIPKWKHVGILDNVVILESKNEQADFFVTDLVSQNTITAPKQDRFPHMHNAFSKGSPAFSISFDPALLSNLLATIASMGATIVKLDFYGPDRALRVKTRLPNTDQRVYGLVMPKME